MAIKTHKPVTPGRRGLITVVDKTLHKGKPCKNLCVSVSTSGGRNNQGRVTVWQRGGGHKRHYRIIDWKRDKDNVPGKVERLEYDPNRSANIALIIYADGERRYIVAPKELAPGNVVISGKYDVPISVGNCMPLNAMPVGSVVHCLEMRQGKGAQLARSAGGCVQLLAKEGVYAVVRLRSGEMRKILASCRGVIGEVGNSEHNLCKLGKAGRSRWLNKRPRVRGVAMNPVDHPLGGGEGRTSGGRPSCSPWGLPEGTRTRNNKVSDKYILRRRKNKSEKQGG